MIISLDRIKTILRIEDIEGYIEYHNAPDDEYDSEAEEIAIAIALNELNERKEIVTEEDALSIIMPIWIKPFNLDEKDMEKRIPYIKNAIQAILG